MLDATKAQNLSRMFGAITVLTGIVLTAISLR